MAEKLRIKFAHWETASFDFLRPLRHGEAVPLLADRRDAVIADGDDGEGAKAGFLAKN